MRNKIFALMAVSLVVLCSTLAIYIGAFTLRPMARDAAMTSAMTGIARSVEMFMVSTKKFNAEFEQASSKQDKDAVRETWTTTIRAVDDAVIHDFGPDNLRVRLVNDPAITGIPSSGGTATAVETDFERKALQQFIDGRNEPIVTEEDGFLKISAPLPASAHPGCANCHDLPVGSKTVLGSINAYAPLKSAIAKSDSEARTVASVLAVMITLVFGCLFWLIHKLVIVRVQAVTKTMLDLARGDIYVAIPFSKGRDELARMGQAINVFRENASQRQRLEAEARADEQKRIRHQSKTEELIDDFRNHVGSLLKKTTSDAARMQATAASLGGIAEASLSNANEATDAANESADSVSTVADSASRIALSINEVADRVSYSAEVVGRASQSALSSNTMIAGLSQAAARIGDVVQVISTIARQTNLLALNATIEAARAGDAGKGFAVVASEVKQLAEQTSAATQEIAKQVDGIQTSTRDSVVAIEAITVSMHEANACMSLIAQSISQQGAATKGISDSALGASEGTARVTNAMEELVGAANLTTVASGNVASVATELVSANEDLASTVETFLRSVVASR